MAHRDKLSQYPWLGSMDAERQAITQVSLFFEMTQELMTEIQESTTQAIKDIVKAQIAKGAPNKGISKTRHAAIVADVVSEILTSFAQQGEDEGKWQRLAMRVVFSGSLLNASQLRSQMEKAGILVPEGTMSSEYGVE